jgi:hypothetical protein
MTSWCHVVRHTCPSHHLPPLVCGAHLSTGRHVVTEGCATRGHGDTKQEGAGSASRAHNCVVLFGKGPLAAPAAPEHCPPASYPLSSTHMPGSHGPVASLSSMSLSLSLCGAVTAHRPMGSPSPHAAAGPVPPPASSAAGLPQHIQPPLPLPPCGSGRAWLMALARAHSLGSRGVAFWRCWRWAMAPSLAAAQKPA